MTGAAIEAYGAQQEICQRSTPDATGQPGRSPLSPAGAVYRLSGHASLPALHEAMCLVAEGADVLRARLRLRPEGYLFEPSGAAGVPVIVADLDGAPPPRVAELLRRSLAMLGDMQNGPLGVLALVRRDDHDLLAAAFDHSVLDQQSALVMVRRMGHVYAHLLNGDRQAAMKNAATEGFLEFAAARQHDAQARAAAAAMLRPAAEAPAPPFAFPGGRWLPWSRRRATTRFTWAATEDDIVAMRRAGAATGSSFLNLLLAGISLVTASLADGEFVPISYMRNGRPPGANGLVGPLWEMVATRSPGDDATTVGDWVRRFAELNAAMPNLSGLSLAHLTPLDHVMELRRVGVNLRMPAPSFAFGPHRAEPVDLASAFGGGPGYEPGVAGINVGVRVFLEPAGGFRVTIQYDPEDLPDPGGFLHAVLDVVRLLAERPQTPFDKALGGERPCANFT